jgi:hypothetical protein
LEIQILVLLTCSGKLSLSLKQNIVIETDAEEEQIHEAQIASIDGRFGQAARADPGYKADAEFNFGQAPGER